MAQSSIQSLDALIVVDVQRDFCSGGALPIPLSEDIIPVLNQWIGAADAIDARLIFSRDWHPPNHVSFHQQGGPWPQHCVQGSRGAEFHPDLKVPERVQVVNKGTDLQRDSYSAFDGTGLAADLQTLGVQRLWIGGLAQDVCVRATVLDACRAGFEVHLITRGTRAVDNAQGAKAIEEMLAAGAILEREGPYESTAA
jgi:nicotinamidase/pyrazinamidase